MFYACITSDRKYLSLRWRDRTWSSTKRQGQDKGEGRVRGWGGGGGGGREGKGPGKFDKIRLLKALKSLVVVGGGRESDYSVCPRPLCQFYAYLCQTGQIVRYSSLHQITLV